MSYKRGWKEEGMKLFICASVMAAGLLGFGPSAWAWVAFGHVACDANLNFDLDLTDSPVPSVLVVVTNLGGSFSNANWTSPEGTYVVPLPEVPDSYRAYLQPQTLPSRSAVELPGPFAFAQFSLPAPPSNIATNDFLIQDLTCMQRHDVTTVHGYVYCDANGNGQLDPGDQPLAGIQIVVRQEYGSYSNSTSTATDGGFAVTIPNFDLSAYRRDPLSQTLSPPACRRPRPSCFPSHCCT
jgi:hypothetical protein